MSWNCTHVEERLTEYLDRLLEPADREGFEAHARGCPKCGPLLHRMNNLVTQMHQMEPLAEPEGLVRVILDRTVGPKHVPSFWESWFGWVGAMRQPRFAMGVAVVILVTLFASQALGIEWSKVTWADLKPVNLYRATDRRVTLLYARGVKFVSGLRVVYEIQSRLQPVSEPEPTPAPQPAAKPGQSENQKDDNQKGRESNRARELNPILTMLAAHLALPGRSF